MSQWDNYCPTVCLTTGGNDTGKVKSEKLRRRFKRVLVEIRDLDGVPIVWDSA